MITGIPPPSGRRNDKAHRAFVPAGEGADGIHLQAGFTFTFRPASSPGWVYLQDGFLGFGCNELPSCAPKHLIRGNTIQNSDSPALF